jgi:hypothetical protein
MKSRAQESPGNRPDPCIKVGRTNGRVVLVKGIHGELVIMVVPTSRNSKTHKEPKEEYRLEGVKRGENGLFVCFSSAHTRMSCDCCCHDALHTYLDVQFVRFLEKATDRFIRSSRVQQQELDTTGCQKGGHFLLIDLIMQHDRLLWNGERSGCCVCSTAESNAVQFGQQGALSFRLPSAIVRYAARERKIKE